MRRPALGGLAALLVVTLASLAPGEAVPPGGMPATVRALGHEPETRRFPVYDARGVRGRDALWRVTEAGGNCCEVYLAATATGRLVEFGGTYPVYSDDRGATWQQVRPGGVLVGGEGAIAPAAYGDVVGVGWDTYSGDHLQAYRYDSEARTWSYAEVPLHEPVYDRPWIAVVPGPVTRVDGTTARYATVVRSNYLSKDKDTFLVSLDGLLYTPMTDAAHVALGLGRTTGYLDPVADPLLDYVQPHRSMRLAPLGGGRLLNVSPALKTGNCPATVLSPAQQWSCFAMEDHTFGDSLVVDSRGWLHEVSVDDGGLRYGMSADGGRTWTETTMTVPGDVALTSSTLLDHKAHGAAGIAAVAAHVQLGTTSQDVVFKLDVSTGTPRLLETMFVGNGDRLSGRGVTELGSRFDFASVAILPDGYLAVAFDDASHEDPVLAVEMPDTRKRPCPRGRHC